MVFLTQPVNWKIVYLFKSETRTSKQPIALLKFKLLNDKFVSSHVLT